MSTSYDGRFCTVPIELEFRGKRRSTNRTRWHLQGIHKSWFSYLIPVCWKTTKTYTPPVKSIVQQMSTCKAPPPSRELGALRDWEVRNAIASAKVGKLARILSFFLQFSIKFNSFYNIIHSTSRESNQWNKFIMKKRKKNYIFCHFVG